MIDDQAWQEEPVLPNSFAESGDSYDDMSLEGSYQPRVVEIMTKEPWVFVPWISIH